MKTKDLIYKLMILDPTGEQECCIENLDIFTIDLLPAYYDGPLQVLIRDPTCPYYNVKSAKYVVSGSKIVLKPISITDAICNDTQLQIDYSQLNKLTQEQYKKSNEKTKQAHIEIENKCELDLFIRWAKEKALTISSNNNEIDFIAKEFYTNDLNRKIEFPSSIANKSLSYNDKRFEQWNQELDLSFDGFDWNIIRK